MALRYVAYFGAVNPAEPFANADAITRSSVPVANSQIERYDMMKLLYEVAKTKVGTLRFSAAYSRPVVDINTLAGLEKFDGWCYPDGREYDPQYFPHLVPVYPPDGAGIHRLPDLRKFFKPVSEPASDRAMKESPGQNTVPPHSHDITVSPANPVTIKDAAFIWISGYESSHTEFGGRYYDGAEIPPSTALHGSNVPKDIKVEARLRDMPISVKKGTPVVSGQTTEDGTAGDAYPAYNMLPVMIYIGLPKLKG